MAVQDKVLLLEDGPWVEMRDSLSPTARKEGAYLLGQNVYPIDPTIGEGLVGRPGCVMLGTQFAGGFPNFIQGIVQFSHGVSEQTVCVAGGEIYVCNWTTRAWTKMVTTTDLTAGAVVLSAVVSVVAFLTVTDKLLVSDGVHQPFLWDGSAGATGLTPLTNCPALYGPPTIYQARVFGIKATDQRTMVWSEADAPTIGYEAGGYNNAWTVRQTDAHPLTRLVGTNNGVVIFRERSVTMAVGDVGPSFQTSNTHEAIDASIGTRTPFAVLEVGPNIAFLDADLNPHVVRPGAVGVVSCWQGFRESLVGGSARANPQQCFAAYYSPAGLVLFAVCDSAASTAVDTVLVLDAKGELPVPVAIWNGWQSGGGASISALAMVLDATHSTAQIPRLLHGDFGDNGSYVYAHGNPDDTVFLTDDAMVTGTQPIHHVVHTQPLGYSTKREKIFDRVDVAVIAPTPMTLAVRAVTPRGITADPQTIVLGPQGQGWDVGLWDVMQWDATIDYALEDHGDVGIDEQGRWIRVELEHQTLGEQFGLSAVTITAYATDDDPPVP